MGIPEEFTKASFRSGLFNSPFSTFPDQSSNFSLKDRSGFFSDIFLPPKKNNIEEADEFWGHNSS
jgi:hypothetical protein